MSATYGGGFNMSDNELGLSLLGPWSHDDLAATLHETVNAVGADSDMPTATRFLGAVAKIVKVRTARDEAQTDPMSPAVFLLRPNPGDIPSVTHRREPMLNSGAAPITGRLWFVSEAANSGRYVELAKDLNSDALFAFITEELQMGDVPALIFDPGPKPKLLRYYPKGLQEDDDCRIFNIGTTDVSDERIFSAIDRVYKGYLITPLLHGPSGKLWKNGRKFHPVPRTELVIQTLLRVGLTTAFLGCTVRAHETMKSGICDILIEESDGTKPGGIMCHAIIELKVLRSFDSSGNSVSTATALKSVKEGVIQAASYRDERPTTLATLCCFDMRKVHTNEQCFSGVRKLAKAKRVSLRAWFIFSSASRYREFTQS